MTLTPIWNVKRFEVSGTYTGSNVYRYRDDKLEVAHVRIAEYGHRADEHERIRCDEECISVAIFLNRAMTEGDVDYIAASAIARAVRHSFPHFAEIEPTPDAVRALGREYMALVMDPGPQEIEFSDHDGSIQRIVWGKGDPSVGVSAGWILA